MASVSTYLNFNRETEAAFNFYKSIFGGEFVDRIHRMSESPARPDGKPIAEADKDLVMHIDLEIMGGHHLHGTDAPESMGFKIDRGNNMFINLQPDTKEETRRLFDLLSVGGKVNMPLTEMFWGGTFGSLTDQYGIQWMFNWMERK